MPLKPARKAEKRGRPSGLLAIRYRKIEAIRPYDRNPRTHTPAQIGKLARSLKRFGWTNPILLADGQIIAGHGRLAAAIQLQRQGITPPNAPPSGAVPTIDLSHLTPAERRAYVIADNRLALDAGWDATLLVEEMAFLREGDIDVALLGFEEDEITAFTSKQAGPTPPGEFAAFGEDIETEYCCPKCKYRWSGNPS